MDSRLLVLLVLPRWCSVSGGQISAITTAWRTMASPGLMKSDFATANLSRGGRNKHANFSPPVARVPGPLAAALVQQPCRTTLVRLSNLCWGLLQKCAPWDPARFLRSLFQLACPISRRCLNRLVGTPPSQVPPPPSHPGCNAVDSQTCSWKREAWDD